MRPGTPGGESVPAPQPPPELVDASLQGHALTQALMAKLEELRARPAPGPLPPSLEQTLATAWAAAQAGDPGAALRQVDIVIRAQPAIARPHVMRGSLLRRLRRLDEALQSLDHAVRVEPRSAAAWCARAEVFEAMSRLPEALACQEMAVSLDPALAQGWSDRGRVLEKLGREVDALASYDCAITADPRFFAAWHNKGALLLRAARADKASECFRQALQLKPDLAPAWANLALAFEALGRPVADSAECYRRMIEADSRQLEPTSRRAIELAEAEQHVKALPLLMALCRFGDDPLLTMHLATAKAKAAALQAAASTTGQAVGAPELLAIAAQLESATEWQRAGELFLEVLGVEPGNTDALQGAARWYARSGAFEDALRTWDELLARELDSAAGLAGRAQALIGMGRFEEAAASGKSAAERDPMLAEARLQWGRALLGLGRVDEAVSSLKAAVERAPASRACWRELALGFERACSWDMAGRAWQGFLGANPQELRTEVQEVQTRRLPGIARRMRIQAFAQREGVGRDDWLALAREMLAEGDTAAAQACVSSIAPPDARVLLAWAVELLRAGLHDAASASAAQALALDGSLADAWALRADCLMRAGQAAIASGGVSPEAAFSEAASSFERLAAMRKPHPSVWESAAVAWTLAGDRARAEAAASQARRTAYGSDPVEHAASDEARAEAEALLREGARLAQSGQVPEAVDAYAQATRLDPCRLDAWLEQGVGLTTLGRLDEALACFESAVRLSPGTALAHDYRGVCLARAGKLEQALGAFAHALALEPASSSVLKHKGSTLANLQRWDEAFDTWMSALRLAPEMLECMLLMADVRERQGRADEALALLRDFLAKAPVHLARHRAVAEERCKRLTSPRISPAPDTELAPPSMRSPASAPTSLRAPAPAARQESQAPASARTPRSIPPGPDSAELGQVMLSRGEVDIAMQAFDAALAISPRSAVAWRNRGIACLKLGRFAQAVADLDRASELDPMQVDTWNDLSAALRQSDNPQRALAVLNTALSLDQNHAPTWSNRARVLSDLGRHDEALHSALRAGKLQPNLADAAANAGRALADLGRLDEAMESWQRARKLAPDEPLHMAGMAAALARMDRLADALQAAEEAYSILPNDPFCRKTLMDIRKLSSAKKKT